MIKLYGFGPTRSVRCKWVLQELGVDFEYVDGKGLIGTAEFKQKHPLGKLPALEYKGEVLFESVAIVNFLAGLFPEKGLLPKDGTWERAMHDQWSCFALTEMEAWLWSNAKHTFGYAEEKRVPQILDRNNEEFLKSAAVLDRELQGRSYLINDRFSAVDINVGYTLNWGRGAGLTGDFANVNAYLDRLHERPRSALKEQTDFIKNLR